MLRDTLISQRDAQTRRVQSLTVGYIIRNFTVTTADRLPRAPITIYARTRMPRGRKIRGKDATVDREGELIFINLPDLSLGHLYLLFGGSKNLYERKSALVFSFLIVRVDVVLFKVRFLNYEEE